MLLLCCELYDNKKCFRFGNWQKFLQAYSLFSSGRQGIRLFDRGAAAAFRKKTQGLKGGSTPEKQGTGQTPGIFKFYGLQGIFRHIQGRLLSDSP